MSAAAGAEPRVDPAWLEARFALDGQARAAHLLRRAAARVAGVPCLRIVDLGAGTGANVRHCLEAFPGDQEWTLVDHDAALLEAGRGRLEGWAAGRGWASRHVPDGLVLRRHGRSVGVRFRHGSLRDLDRLADLEATDLVAANALFDLLSAEQFRGLARTLAAHRVPCYATLNYRAMRFAPEDEQTRHYVHLYEAHMRRPRPSGAAMGAACVPQMTRVIGQLGGTVARAPSVWTIGPRHLPVLEHLLAFMHAALAEMLPAPEDRQALDMWATERRALARAGRLALTVAHEDLLF